MQLGIVIRRIRNILTYMFLCIFYINQIWTKTLLRYRIIDIDICVCYEIQYAFVVFMIFCNLINELIFTKSFGMHIQDYIKNHYKCPTCLSCEHRISLQLSWIFILSSTLFTIHQSKSNELQQLLNTKHLNVI